MIRFKAPDHFQFDQTVAVLQRGPFDPINRVEAGKWTSCFRLSEQVVLIECHGGPTIALPLNLLAGPWIKDVAALKALGASRLSTGSALIREVVTHLQAQVSPFIDELSCAGLSPALSYEAFNRIFVESGLE